MQYVHNILIAMPGSKLTVASTCTYHCSSKHSSDGSPEERIVGGQHYGVAEFYVEKDAEMCFSMVGKLSLLSLLSLLLLITPIIATHPIFTPYLFTDSHVVQLIRGVTPFGSHRRGKWRVLQQLRLSGARRKGTDVPHGRPRWR